MIDAIIVDDEKKAITALKNDLLEYCPEVKVESVFTNANEALLYLECHHPGIVFLDIELSIMNGFDFVAALQKPVQSNIIFVTAYNEFAIRAFKVDALDYLLKPIDPDELKRAVQKVLKLKKETHQKEAEQFAVRREATNNRIALPVNNGYHLINPEHIIYCKAAGSYTQVVLDNDKSFLISRNLGRTQDLLPKENFERVHQSFIVNLNQVKKYRKGESPEAVMTNDDIIKVSRQNKDRLAGLLGIG